MSSEARSVTGHLAARAHVLAALRQDAVPHGLLVSGEEGIGKATFVCWVAQTLWCPARSDDGGACEVCSSCRKISSGNHPDLIVVRRGVTTEADNKSRGSQHEITVAQVREQVVAGLGWRPVEASGKLVVILGADDMNDEAQNALLKSLEEPPAGSRLILIAAREDRLLETIRSRCQVLRLQPLSTAELADALPDVDPAWRALCRGRPGLLASLASLDAPALLAAFDAVLAGRVPGSVFAARIQELLRAVGDGGVDADADAALGGPFVRSSEGLDEREAASLAVGVLHARLRDHALTQARPEASTVTYGLAAPSEALSGPNVDWPAAERALLEAAEDVRRHVPGSVCWTALGLSLTMAARGSGQSARDGAR